jgi:hypothetical protein
MDGQKYLNAENTSEEENQTSLKRIHNGFINIMEKNPFWKCFYSYGKVPNENIKKTNGLDYFTSRSI